MSADVKLHPAPAIERPIRLFLCGDVMTGRGIDQTLPNPCNPRLREGYLQTAMAYVRIAEEANGPQTESNRRPLQCHRRDRRNSVIPPPAGTGLCWHCKATCIWTRRSW